MQDEVAEQQDFVADDEARATHKRRIYIKIRLEELKAEKASLREELETLRN